MTEPQTVDDIVDQISNELNVKERAKISKLRSHEIKLLQLVFGIYTNEQLLKYKQDENAQDLNDGFAVAHIIQRLKDKLC